jgi:hypothetical protein
MNQERLKLIIKNLESLVNCLKEEIQEPIKYNYEEVVSYIEDDVDEYYVEEEEYV